MQPVARVDRLAFWSFTSAGATFLAAAACLDELRKKEQISDNNLRYAMVCSFVVLYGRAFKQKKNVRMIEDLVPEEFRALHRHLLVLRDKTFAHFDPDGPDASRGVWNKAKILARNGGFAAALNYFRLDEREEERAATLVGELQAKCSYHALKIWRRHMKADPAPDGEYEVSLDADPAPLLRVWKPFVK